MSLTPEFKDAVQKGNLTLVRIMLKDNLLLGSGKSGFDDFNNMLDFAKGRLPKLMDGHNGEVFKEQAEWNDSYLNAQMTKVVNNFSEERIDLLKKIISFLYKAKPLSQPKSVTHSIVTQKNFKSLSPKQKTGLAISAVGAISVIGGIVFECNVIVPIAGGIAAVGGLMYFLKCEQN